MLYILLVLLVGGIICLDYLPKRRLMIKPLRVAYLVVCGVCSILLLLYLANVPLPRIATGLIWVIKHMTGA